MKKHILSFALIAALIGSIATGCGSTKSSSTSSSSSSSGNPDSTKMKSPTDTASNRGVDTSKAKKPI